MNTTPITKRFRKISLVFLIVLWITILMSCLPIGYGDVLLDNLTFEDAQNLVSFPICITTYIPVGIDPEPRILYDADAANVPEETYIRLQYHYQDSREKVFEVYQRYTSHTELKIEYPDSQMITLQRQASIKLVWWIMDSKWISESETDEAVEQVKIDTSVHQTGKAVWWLEEIVEPIEYRSTMTEWIKDHVEYNILSYLPADEIKKITLSMLECSSP